MVSRLHRDSVCPYTSGGSESDTPSTNDMIRKSSLGGKLSKKKKRKSLLKCSSRVLSKTPTLDDDVNLENSFKELETTDLPIIKGRVTVSLAKVTDVLRKDFSTDIIELVFRKYQISDSNKDQNLSKNEMQTFIKSMRQHLDMRIEPLLIQSEVVDAYQYFSLDEKNPLSLEQVAKWLIIHYKEPLKEWSKQEKASAKASSSCLPKLIGGSFKQRKSSMRKLSRSDTERKRKDSINSCTSPVSIITVNLDDLLGRWWTPDGTLVDIAIDSEKATRAFFTDSRGRQDFDKIGPFYWLDDIKVLSSNNAGIAWENGMVWCKVLQIPSPTVFLLLNQVVDELVIRNQIHKIINCETGVFINNITNLVSEPSDGSKTRWIAASVSTAFWISSRDCVRDFMFYMMRGFSQKSGDIFQELSDNLVFSNPANASTVLLSLVDDMCDTYGPKHPKFCGAQLLVLLFISASSVDIDRMLGFTDTPPYSPKEIGYHDYSVKHEGTRNTDILKEIYHSYQTVSNATTSSVYKKGYNTVMKWCRTFQALMTCQERVIADDLKRKRDSVSRSPSIDLGDIKNNLHKEEEKNYLVHVVSSVPEEIFRKNKNLQSEDLIYTSAPVVLSFDVLSASEGHQRTGHSIVYKISRIRDFIPPLSSTATSLMLPALCEFRVIDSSKTDHGLIINIEYQRSFSLVDESPLFDKCVVMQGYTSAESRLRTISKTIKKKDCCAVSISFTGVDAKSNSAKLMNACENNNIKDCFDYSEKVNSPGHRRTLGIHLQKQAAAIATSSGAGWRTLEGELCLELLLQAELCGLPFPTRRPFGRVLKSLSDGFASDAVALAKEAESVAHLLSTEIYTNEITPIDSFNIALRGVHRAVSQEGPRREDNYQQLLSVQHRIEELDYTSTLSLVVDWSDQEVLGNQSWKKAVETYAGSINTFLGFVSKDNPATAEHVGRVLKLQQSVIKGDWKEASRTLVSWDLNALAQLGEDGIRTPCGNPFKASQQRTCEKILRSIVHINDYGTLIKETINWSKMFNVFELSRGLSEVCRKKSQNFGTLKRSVAKKLFKTAMRLMQSDADIDEPDEIIWSAVLAILNVVGKLGGTSRATESEREEIADITHRLARDGNNDALEIILQSCPSLKKDSYFSTALIVSQNTKHLAALTGEALTTLLDIEGSMYSCPMNVCCYRSRFHTLDLLLLNWGDPSTEEDGQSPLTLAAAQPSFESSDGLELIKRLIPEKNKKLMTTKALQVSSKINITNISLLMIQSGGDVTHVDTDGSSIFHTMCSSLQFSENADGNTAIKLAANKLTCSLRDKAGETPLHRAASYGCIVTVGILIEAGADPSLRASEAMHCRTALHYAITTPVFECGEGFKAILAMATPESLSAVDTKKGQTPKQLAESERKSGIVALLQ